MWATMLNSCAAAAIELAVFMAPINVMAFLPKVCWPLLHMAGLALPVNCPGSYQHRSC